MPPDTIGHDKNGRSLLVSMQNTEKMGFKVFTGREKMPLACSITVSALETHGHRQRATSFRNARQVSPAAGSASKYCEKKPEFLYFGDSCVQ